MRHKLETIREENSKFEARNPKQSPKFQNKENPKRLLPFDHSSYFCNSNLFRISTFGFRICRSALLLASLQLSSVAYAQSDTTPADEKSPAIAQDNCVEILYSNDEVKVDCVTTEDSDKDSSKIDEDSSDPDKNSNISAGPAVDRMRIPSRYEQSPPDFAVTSFDPVTLRRLGVTPILLLPIDSSYSFHQLLHERAPPSLA